jgi:hypothetical protein
MDFAHTYTRARFMGIQQKTSSNQLGKADNKEAADKRKEDKSEMDFLLSPM